VTSDSESGLLAGQVHPEMRALLARLGAGLRDHYGEPVKPLNTVDLSGKADNPQAAGLELYRAFRAAALEGTSSVITVDGSALALIVPDPGFPADLVRE